MRLAAFGILLLIVACGKVGDPQPPFIRVPQAAMDLNAAQIGEDIVLIWTNPARNIDGSAATDLSRAEILSGEKPVADVGVAGPGQAQSHSMPMGPAGSSQSFAVRFRTSADKRSGLSNTVSITPVDVPGAVDTLNAVVDQHRIILVWQRPRKNPELANVYLIQRGDLPDVETVTDTRFEDSRFETGKTYTYEVRGARQVDVQTVPGVGPERISIQASDRMPPRVPQELQIVVTDSGAFVTWAENPESDLAGYRVFRSEQPDSGFTLIVERLHSTNGIFDPAYRPGLYYAVAAVDESGNSSVMSPAVRAPSNRG